MKRFFFIISMWGLCVFSCFAQHSIGGDFGFGIQAITGNSVAFMLNIEPRYTYTLNEKNEVGSSLAFGTSKGLYREGICFDWSVNPFYRFRIVGIQKFGFWLEAKAGLGTSNWKDSKRTHLHWGLNLNPVFTYQISEHFRMDATFGFLGVGLNSYTEFNNGKANYTYIDFGAHLANGSLTSLVEHVEPTYQYLMNYGQSVAGRSLVKNITDFQIGFVYQF